MTKKQLQEQTQVTTQLTKEEIKNKVLTCLNSDQELILNPREDFYYLEFNDFDLGRPETVEEEAERSKFDNFYNYERILKAKEIGWNRIIPKIVNTNGKKVIRRLLETPEEAQKRLFENIEEATEKVRRDIKKSDGKLQYIEGKFDLICDANDMGELKLFFRDKWLTLFDDNRPCSPLNSLINKNYKNAQNRVNKLKEKLFDQGWKLCSLSPLTDLQIEELTNNDYIPFLDWTGKTYKGFNPFDFTLSQVNKLIDNEYQASDLDGSKYKNKDPFKKSKVEWDAILSQENDKNKTPSDQTKNPPNPKIPPSPTPKPPPTLPKPKTPPQKDKSNNSNATQAKTQVKRNLEAKLQTNNLQLGDLATNMQTKFASIKDGTIDIAQLNTTEQELTKHIGEVGAQKKVTELQTEVSQALQGQDEQKKTTAKTKVNQLLSNCSSDIYLQAHHSELTTLLAQLNGSAPQKKNDDNDQQNQDGGKWPWGVTISLVSIVFVVIFFYLAVKKKK